MTDKAETELKACPNPWFGEVEKINADLREIELMLSDECRAGKPYKTELERAKRATKASASLLDESATTLSRPTQTADAVTEAMVEAAARAIAIVSTGSLYDLHIEEYIPEAQAALQAALSTSDDSGDREGVEAIVGAHIKQVGSGPFVVLKDDDGNWLTRTLKAHKALTDADTFVQKLHRSPTPQDSGLADELEAVPGDTHWNAGDAYSHTRYIISSDLRDRILTALRQPRNDGELLRENHELCAQLSRIREAINYSGATTDAYLDDMVKADRDRLSLRQMAKKFGVGVGRIRGSLARLDQGEG